MKFITNTFSLNMLVNTNVCLLNHNLTEDEFQALCAGAESCIGDEKIAKALNLPHNPEGIKARVGDIILTAYYRAGTLNFNCMQILEQENPLERILCEEEV